MDIAGRLAISDVLKSKNVINAEERYLRDHFKFVYIKDKQVVRFKVLKVFTCLVNYGDKLNVLLVINEMLESEMDVSSGLGNLQVDQLFESHVPGVGV